MNVRIRRDIPHHLRLLRQGVALVALLSLILVGCRTAWARPYTPPRQVVVAQVTDLGAIGHPTSAIARDAAVSGQPGPGSQIVWLFGDTLLSPPAADGASLRTNTCAVATLQQPLTTIEPLDATGAPYQCIPFTPAELAYNISTGKADDRIALWPMGVIPGTHNSTIVTFIKIHVMPGFLNYATLGIGFGIIKPGWTKVDRVGDVLFTAPEPALGAPLIVGDMVYLYGAIAGSVDHSVAVARVSRLQFGIRSNFQFWNGSTWVADATQAAPVMHVIPGGISVSYNAYLGQFIAVHSEALSNRIMLQTAANPEGPWSAPIALFTGQTPAMNATDYAGIAHVEQATNGGKTIIVTYAHPLTTFTLDMRYVQVTFG